VPLKHERATAIDFVLIRESTEGLFAERDTPQANGRDVATDLMQVTRQGCDRLFKFAFDLAARRKAKGHPGHLTSVDKANVLGSMAFFRNVFDEHAARHPDIETSCRYVDAMALSLIRNPWDYDVLVTENMFGDILSDEGAALMGGLGFAPSADIGEDNAVFQPCHGTAPDIMGTGKANPVAMFLSGALMLEWLGERHGEPVLSDAASRLTSAVEAAFAQGELRPVETGGPHELADITDAVAAQLR
jgi:3-isopropylmalate dehydrogenase